MITLFTSTFNDEIMIPHFIKWYRDRFPNCRIVVGDNRSTDSTEKICKNLGCEFRSFDSGGYIPVEIGLWVKNNSWKESTSDWVIFVDCDEFLDINQGDLKKEDEEGTSLIRTQGWDIYNLEDNFDIENMHYGCRNILYDKIVCFKKSKIKEINFSIGAHSAKPEGDIKLSKNYYNLLHKKYVNLEYVENKIKTNLNRVVPAHVERGWSHDIPKIGKIAPTYLYDISRNVLEQEFEKNRKKSIPIKIKSGS